MVTKSNAINVSQTGVVYFNGTASFTGSGNGSSGQVLQSQGASTPAYSSATYPSSCATGDLIYGSGTNVLSTLSAPTTSGEFFCYNTSPYWANYYNTITYYEDFLENNLSFSAGGGGSGGTNYPSTYQTYQHPGVLDIYTSGGYANYSVHSKASYMIGGGQIWIDVVAKLSSLASSSDNFAMFLGLSDTQDTTSSNNNIIFSYKYNQNSGKWQVICQNAGTTTTTNTSTTADTNWHRYSISINAAATSVTFYIDGASVGTITTNIPANTTSLNFFVANVNQGNSSGASEFVAVDLMYYYQSLTTPR